MSDHVQNRIVAYLRKKKGFIPWAKIKKDLKISDTESAAIYQDLIASGLINHKKISRNRIVLKAEPANEPQSEFTSSARQTVHEPASDQVKISPTAVTDDWKLKVLIALKKYWWAFILPLAAGFIILYADEHGWLAPETNNLTIPKENDGAIQLENIRLNPILIPMDSLLKPGYAVKVKRSRTEGRDVVYIDHRLIWYSTKTNTYVRECPYFGTIEWGNRIRKKLDTIPGDSLVIKRMYDFHFMFKNNGNTSINIEKTMAKSIPAKNSQLIDGDSIMPSSGNVTFLPQQSFQIAKYRIDELDQTEDMMRFEFYFEYLTSSGSRMRNDILMDYEQSSGLLYVHKNSFYVLD